MRMLFVLCVVAVVVAAPGVWADAPGGDEGQVPKSVSWHESFEAAVRAAVKSKKPVLVDFYTEWCGYCGQMDDEVFPQPEIVKLSTKFECVKVDAEKRKDLKDKYGVSGFPSYVFVDSKGKDFYRTGGYAPAPVFGVRLRWALDAYKHRAELAGLAGKHEAATATPRELARLGFLLREVAQNRLARTVLAEALVALSPDDTARPGALLDKLTLDERTAPSRAVPGLKDWVASYTEHERRWEGKFRYGIARANSDSLEPAVKALDEVAKESPKSDWGILAKYYAARIQAELSRPQSPG